MWPQVRSESLILPRNWAMFRVIIGAPAASASAAITRAALVLAVRPITRPLVSAAQIRANAAMTCVLPVPAGATRQLMSRAEVSRPAHAPPWGGSRSVPPSPAPAPPAGTDPGPPHRGAAAGL